MKIGIDVVDIKELNKRIERNPDFVHRLLTIEEIQSGKIDTIAGKIAAKEAIVKTGYLKVGDWLKVKILNLDTGEPAVFDNRGRKINRLQLSITHSQKIAVAVALYDKSKRS